MAGLGAMKRPERDRSLSTISSCGHARQGMHTVGLIHPVRVSVIIDNRNYARFLGDAIKSALDQRWPHCEVIVVDDGSTDESREIISKFGRRLRHVFKDRGGQASALNAGMKVATGDVCIFLDSDDMLLSHIAESVAEAWSQDPLIAKIQYSLRVVDELGKPTGAMRPLPHAHLLSGDLRRHYLAFPDDVWRLPTSGNAFPSRLLAQIMPIPEMEYEAGADTYLTHLAPLYGTVRTLSTVGGLYRIHGGNGYELATHELNLARIRRDVSHSAKTRRHIAAHAARLGLRKGLRAEDIESVSLVANRLICLRLDQAAIPFETDTRARLAARGLLASRARFDVTRAMRLTYIAWFLGMTLLPRRWAAWLAAGMVFPDRRVWFNRYITRWTRS